MDPFKFIDLFAGIGGMRIPFESLGGTCIFSSEWDAHAQQTYYHNFREMPAGDITKIDVVDIPDHDILLAGFPCQPFSTTLLSRSLKGITDEKLLLELARRGYNLPKLDANDETTAEIIKIG